MPAKALCSTSGANLDAQPAQATISVNRFLRPKIMAPIIAQTGAGAPHPAIRDAALWL